MSTNLISRQHATMMFHPKYSNPTRIGHSTNQTTPVVRTRLQSQRIIRLTKTMMNGRLWLRRGHRIRLARTKQEEVTARPFLPPILASIATQGYLARLMMMRASKSVCSGSNKASRLKLRLLRRSRSRRMLTSNELNPSRSR